MGYANIQQSLLKVENWIDLISMIKSGSQSPDHDDVVNVNDQALYFDIIGLSCVGKQGQGIETIQNMVCDKLLLGQNQFNGLLRFGIKRTKNKLDVERQEPYLVFLRDENCNPPTTFSP